MKFLFLKNIINKANTWTVLHQFQLTIFNIILILLFVLRSAGYFHPFFPITVNFITFFSIVLSVFLLGARSRALFVITLVFWLFTAIMRFFEINVWAERTAVYAFQSFFIGLLILIYEIVLGDKRKNK